MAKNSIIYILGKALSIIISILLLPLYTSRIPTSSYGYYDLINTLITYGVTVLVLNISIAVLRFGYEENSDKKKLFSTSSSFTIVMSTIAAVCIIIANIFYKIKYMPIIIVLIFITGFTNLGGSFARCQNKSKLYAYSGIIAGLVNACVGIICVYVFHLEDLALFLSLLISHFIQATFLFFATKSFKYISFKSISMSNLKSMLIFSSPHAFSLLCVFLCRDIDKTIISIFLGDDTLGIFSMSLKYMGFITAIVDALALAWSDTTFSVSDKNDRISSSVVWVNNMTRIASFISVLFIPLIFVSYPYLIKGSYIEAFSIIPIIYSSVFFIICSGFYANSFLSEKKPLFLMISRLIAASVNLVLVFSLMNKIGIYAIAIGYVSSAVVEFFISYIFARSKLHMTFSLKPVLFFLPAYCSVTLIYYFGNSYSNLAIMCLLLIVLYLVFHKKIHDSIKKISIKFSSEKLVYLDFVDRDIEFCKKNAFYVLKIAGLLALNILACFGIYLLSFLTSYIWAMCLIIVALIVVSFLNCIIGKKIFFKLSFKKKSIYFVALIIVSWVVCSVPISFVNDILFDLTENTFGSMSFLASLIFFVFYFFVPLFFLGVQK